MESEENCCGCSACAVICPVNVIKMRINKDGFYRPIIDERKCINCNLCNKVCEEKKEEIYSKDIFTSNVYSAYTKNNEIRRTSSSGGIAHEISLYGIENDYSICGVVYDENEKCAKHIILNNSNINGINLLQGSKYLQSKNLLAFRKILNLDKAIIFGTPCQISGLNAILKRKKIRDKFILIDIFCHGVPSYNLWNKYLDYIRKKYDIGETPKVCFREKKLGWHKYYIKIEGNSRSYIKDRESDPFLKTFCSGICNSISCYNCIYRTKASSDIRLGDYWGKRYEMDEKGYSMVIANTEMGNNFINNLKNIEVIKMPIQDIKNQQTNKLNIPEFRMNAMLEVKKENPNFKKIVVIYHNHYLIKSKKVFEAIIYRKSKRRILNNI